MLELDLRTLQRWQQTLREGARLEDGRRAAAATRRPVRKLSEAEREAILQVCNQGEFRSLPPSQIVPRLTDRGEYLASESTLYRVLRAAGQGQRRGKARAPSGRSRPRSHEATGPNQVWSWDITFLASSVRGAFYRLYLMEDIYSRKIVGNEVHAEECAEHASRLIHKACLAEGVHQPGLVLHSDNGSPMKGATMLATLQRLGVVPSFSRPSVSDDNPYSESLFRTLKYTPAFPTRPFESLAAARRWVHRFVQWYNGEHRHSAVRFVTPNERHSGAEHDILARRAALYEAAKARHPTRWSGTTRNWQPVASVWLNPPKEHHTRRKRDGAAKAA